MTSVTWKYQGNRMQPVVAWGGSPADFKHRAAIRHQKERARRAKEKANAEWVMNRACALKNEVCRRMFGSKKR